MNEVTRSQLEKLKIKCPECSNTTDSLKRYNLADLLVFVGIAGWVRHSTHTACPACMRTILLKNMFSWNVLTANVLWLLFFWPYDLILMAASTTKGHSKSVIDVLMKSISNPPGASIRGGFPSR